MANEPNHKPSSASAETVPPPVGGGDDKTVQTNAGGTGSRVAEAVFAGGPGGVLDHYELQQLIGRGGMGVVYLARDTATGQTVALKQISPMYLGSEKARNRFYKEAENMRRVAHANILPVLDIGRRADAPYYVMPYIAGGSVARFVEGNKALRESEALAIAVQVAEALKFAHDVGVIHRDIKPENVLVNGQGVAFVADFGLVKSLFENETVPEGEARFTIGTARYMAPEIAEGKAGDTRADIYAFGAMLYELASGFAPFDDRDDVSGTQQIIRRLLTEAPTPVQQLNPLISDGLKHVIERAMARQLCDRYAHMKYVVEDLAAIVRGATPGSAPATPGATEAVTAAATLLPRAGRASTRSRLSLATVGVLAVVGAAAAYVAMTANADRHAAKASTQPQPAGETHATPVVSIPTTKPAAGVSPVTPPVSAKSNDAAILSAVISGKESEAIDLLMDARYASPVAWPTSAEGVPLLHLAARHGRVRVVEFLVKERGGDINAVHEFSRKTPLDEVDAAVHPDAVMALRKLEAKTYSELRDR
ncbi:MAG: protein kinase [Tepidisphaeraceae bacterium]